MGATRGLPAGAKKCYKTRAAWALWKIGFGSKTNWGQPLSDFQVRVTILGRGLGVRSRKRRGDSGTRSGLCHSAGTHICGPHYCNDTLMTLSLSVQMCSTTLTLSTRAPRSARDPQRSSARATWGKWMYWASIATATGQRAPPADRMAGSGHGWLVSRRRRPP